MILIATSRKKKPRKEIPYFFGQNWLFEMESPILRRFMVSIERVLYVLLFGNSNVVASNSLDAKISDLREIEATGDNHDHFDKAFGIHSNVEDRAHKEHHRHGLQRPNQAAGGNFHTQKDSFLYIKLFHVTSESINKFASKIPNLFSCNLVSCALSCGVQIRSNPLIYQDNPRVKTALEMLEASTFLEKHLNEVSI